jgi:hypothetical protein
MPFTATELEQTKSVAGTFSLTMPYLAKNQPIPAPVVADIRTLLIELGADGIVVGAMKACDVAIKRLANTTDRSLPDAGVEIGEILDRLQTEDRLDYGSQAYDDAKQCAVVMTEAMVARGQADFSPIFDRNDPEIHLKAFRAWTALLVSIILMLGVLYGIGATEASRRLNLEIATITPT